MSVPSYEPSIVSPQFDSTIKTPAGNIAAQLTYQDSILNGSINRITSTVTGVTLTYTGIAASARLLPGQYTLDFIQSTKMLSIGGGAGVDVTAGGTFTLVAPNGKTISAVCVAVNYAGTDKSDEITFGTGIGKDIKQILWIQDSTGSEIIQGTQFIKQDFELNISGIVNVLGVALNFTGLTDGQKLEIGTHLLDYVTSGTLLSIGGGAGVDVGAGGTFTLISPSGTKVKAVVTVPALVAGNVNDTITVGSFVKSSLVVSDNTLKNSLSDIYSSI